MTGIAAGYCAGYMVPGYMNPGLGGGWGRGNRYYATGSSGWQRAASGMPAYGGPWAYPPAYGAPYAYPPVPTREQEREALENQVGYLEEALESLRTRIDELESEPEETGECGQARLLRTGSR